MNPQISVIIPTHNPNPTRLERTLQGLKVQTLASEHWELIVVDNATVDPTNISGLDFSWHNSTQIVREERLGLTRARIAGIQASRGTYLVFVDDDNVLQPKYLEFILNIFQQYPSLGAIGGKSLPEFEVEPESWVKQFWDCLALRDLGNEHLIYSYERTTLEQRRYPEFAPIGAGMALRRSAAEAYVNSILDNKGRLALDRTGKSLQSGGDCDINLTVLEMGWEVGYFPQLQLTHLITAQRVTKAYLARLSRASCCSWVQVLSTHGICPWKKIARWTLLPRKIKAFFRFQPWIAPAAYIQWQGACGLLEGQAKL